MAINLLGTQVSVISLTYFPKITPTACCGFSIGFDWRA